MPRAFLITHRRYNPDEMEFKEMSPERSVSLAESSNSEYNDTENSSECPDELYNLTKLADVSLAAAAGKILDHRHLSTAESFPEDGGSFTYTHKLFDKSSRAPRPHLLKRSSHLIQSSPPLQIKSQTLPTSTSTESSSISHTNFPKTDSLLHNTTDPFHADPQHEHECSDCGKRYSTSSNLARHRQTHRSPGDKKARRCPHCDKLYVSMPAYSMHVRTHNQGCRCQFCGKCFSRPWLLQGHIRTHTGEKPFKCTICHKAFADKSNLRAHVQTHSNTKPHVCGRCGKAFALKSYLYKHEESSCMRINTPNTTITPRPILSSRDSSPTDFTTPSSSSLDFNSHSLDFSTPSLDFHPSPNPPITSKSLSLASVKSEALLIKSEVSSTPPEDTLGGVASPVIVLSPCCSKVEPLVDSYPVIKTPVYYRSTVISPNPERLIYSRMEHPTVLLNAASRHSVYEKFSHQEQPVDFSRGVKLAIAV